VDYKIKTALALFFIISLIACPGTIYSADESKTTAPPALEVKAGKVQEADAAPTPQETAVAPTPQETAVAPTPQETAVAPTPQETAPQAQVQAEEPQESGVANAAELMPVDLGNITVNFKGADIRTVLSYLSEVSGLDIVPSPDVTGTVDLKLTDKPWQVALDIIVRNYGFAYEKEGDIIRVITVGGLQQEELKTQTFNLNYGSAEDISVSIKEMVSSRGKVMFDERTNILLVTDIPTNIYTIGQIINKLDKKTSQVLIEARIIETVLDDTEKLGIDWNIKFAVSGAKRPTTFPFNYFKAPFNSESIHGKLENYFPQSQVSAPSSTTTGSGGATVTDTAGEFPATNEGVFAFPYALKDDFSFGTIDFSQFSAIAEFLKSRADTDVISNPRIATLDNTEALINVGQTLNLPTYERSAVTGRMEITGYAPKDLGVILRVTPHINAKDEIVVDLTPEITDLIRYDTLDAATGIVAPVFSTRQAKTQVRIRDGEIIFIGGLIKENDIKVNRPIPILGDLLGDIPGLGLLFTKKETQKQKVELIMFISVNIIRTDSEIKDVPDSNKARIPQYVMTQEPDKGAKKKKKSRDRD